MCGSTAVNRDLIRLSVVPYLRIVYEGLGKSRFMRTFLFLHVDRIYTAADQHNSKLHRNQLPESGSPSPLVPPRLKKWTQLKGYKSNQILVFLVLSKVSLATVITVLVLIMNSLALTIPQWPIDCCSSFSI